MAQTQGNQTNRQSMIVEVLRDLAALKNKPDVNQYAVEENIEFFKACRSLSSYIWWLIKRAPKIDGKKLLEINDLLPKWDRVMHNYDITALWREILK